ncbi:MAG: hypothetical protein IJW14_03990 [Oscillospiraceae bacterium]|nr:hypothetical protein [Oscillospiraceae bacterium]
MKYKVVPAAMVIQGSSTEVSAYFQKLIDEQARQGWRFYSMETATSEQAPGCILLSTTPVRTQMNLLVFCKPEPGDLEMGGYVPQTSAPQVAAPTPEPAPAPAVQAPSKKQTESRDGYLVCGVCKTKNLNTRKTCWSCGKLL